MPRSFRQFLKEQAQADEQRIDPKTFNLKALYHDLNIKLCDGALPDNIPVSFGKPPKGASGITYCKVTKNRITRQITTIEGSISIVIESRPWTIEKLCGVLAHEMIHAYLNVKNMHEHDYHGVYFVSTLARWKARAGFDIPLKHQTSEEEFREGPKKRVAFLLYKRTDGNFGFALLSPNLTPDDMATGRSFVDFFTKRGYPFAMFGYGLTSLANLYTIQRGIAPKPNRFGRLVPREPKFAMVPMNDVSLLNPQQIIHHVGQLPQF